MMTKKQLKRRKWLLANRCKLKEIERYELSKLERLWEVYCGKAVQAGKVVTYLALAMMVGGCHSDDCRHIRALQERIMTPGEPLPRKDKDRPVGVREQWIAPQSKDDPNDLVS